MRFIPSSGRGAIKLVFLAALAARLPFWLSLRRHPASLETPDTVTYVLPARNLLAHGVFSASAAPPLVPDAGRTPGYPLFLAAHFLVADGLAWPALTQVLLDSGTAALVASAAVLASAQPAAWVAGLFYALDPLVAAHAPLALSESLYAFLLALTAWLLLRAGARASPAGLVAASGFCLGAATFVRPISVYLWLPWSLALAWAWPAPARRRAAAFAAASLVLPALWCARNLAVWGDPGYNPVRATDAVVWEAAAVWAKLEGTSADEERQRLAAEARRRHPEPFRDPLEEASALREVGREVLREHPGVVLRLFPVSLAKMMLGPGLDTLAGALWPGQPLSREQSPAYALAGSGTRGVLRQRPLLWPLALWLALLLAAQYGLAALAVWRLRRDRFALAACVVPAAFLAAVSSGGWAYYRHRLAFMPLVAVLAGWGWAFLSARRQGRPPA